METYSLGFWLMGVGFFFAGLIAQLAPTLIFDCEARKIVASWLRLRRNR